MKINFLCLIAIFTITYVQAQNQTSVEKKTEKGTRQLVRSQRYLNDVTALDEGYNEFEGGVSAIKDYLVRGKVNLVKVTYGVIVATSSYNHYQNKQKYYLQKTDQEYRELFLTNQNPSLGATMLAGGTVTGKSLNDRKFIGSMLTSSKATLTDIMGDNADVLAKIRKLKKINQSSIKNLVKTYNQ